jgi:hypothetical protein
MPSKTEGLYRNEFLITKLPGNMSVEKVTIASGQNLKAGAVLGKLTTGGKYTAVTPATFDGAQTAVAILMADCDASSADQTAMVYVRFTEVNSNEIGFGTCTAGQITTAIGQLATVTIFVRTAI